MSRYIDADDVLTQKKPLEWQNTYEQGTVEGWNQAIDYIGNFAPTADGVIKVIPCEKCFYAKPYNKVWQLPKYNGVLWCTHCEEEKLPDWFCADAIERMVEKNV